MRALLRLAYLKSLMDARSRWFAGMPAMLAHFDLLRRIVPLSMITKFLL